MANISTSTTSRLRAVVIGRGTAWLTGGFGYFMQDALAWVGVTILLFVIPLALSFIPFLGNVAAQILMPVFIAGLMLGCRAREQGGEFNVAHLFAGFSQQTSQLIILGLLYIAAVIVLVILIVILTIIGMGTGFLESLSGGDVAVLRDNFRFVSLVLLITLGLYVPVLMAFWFAPALVILRNAGAVDAIKLSFEGCLLNIVPFLLYGFIGLVLSIIALIPMGLGLLVLVPVIMASVYVAYRDIYPE
ncbi:MAG: BPSS1780 family membrane protein [Gammaproteobacteria bacterium]